MRSAQVRAAKVPVEVEWAELAVADSASSYAEFFPKVYFQPLVDTLSAVASGDIGKSPLREGLKKIVIRNAGEFYSPAGISFADGVLTCRPGSTAPEAGSCRRRPLPTTPWALPAPGRQKPLRVNPDLLISVTPSSSIPPPRAGGGFSR